jgi:hypothetical protein
VNKTAIALALALVGSTGVALAQQGKPAEGKAPQSFAERKQHMLERMDQRIQSMQKTRECLSQAQDEQAARACRPARGPRQGAHEGHMGGDHMAQHTAMHAAEHAQGGDAEHAH